jgi:hypothetical protein
VVDDVVDVEFEVELVLLEVDVVVEELELVEVYRYVRHLSCIRKR